MKMWWIQTFVHNNDKNNTKSNEFRKSFGHCNPTKRKNKDLFSEVRNEEAHSRLM